MKHTDKLNAIRHIRPNAGFILRGDEVEWLDSEQTEPNESEIEAGLISYQSKVAEDEAIAVANKATALAKLAALGLTADDLKALGLGGN